MRKIIFITLLLAGCAHTPFFEDPEFKAQNNKISDEWNECIFENITELSNYSDDIFNIANSAVSSCGKHRIELSTLLRKYTDASYARETSQKIENSKRKGFAVKLAVEAIKRKKDMPFYPTEANGAKWEEILGNRYMDIFIDANSIERRTEGIFYFWSKEVAKSPQNDNPKPIDQYIISNSVDCSNRIAFVHTLIVFYKKHSPDFVVFNPPKEEETGNEFKFKIFCNDS